jgi:hypothetical protein
VPDHLETPEKISSILRGVGLKVHEKRINNGGDRFRVVYHQAEIGPNPNWEGIKDLCMMPVDIWKLGSLDKRESEATRRASQEDYRVQALLRSHPKLGLAQSSSTPGFLEVPSIIPFSFPRVSLVEGQREGENKVR